MFLYRKTMMPIIKASPFETRDDPTPKTVITTLEDVAASAKAATTPAAPRPARTFQGVD